MRMGLVVCKSCDSKHAVGEIYFPASTFATNARISDSFTKCITVLPIVSSARSSQCSAMTGSGSVVGRHASRDHLDIFFSIRHRTFHLHFVHMLRKYKGKVNDPFPISNHADSC